MKHTVLFILLSSLLAGCSASSSFTSKPKSIRVAQLPEKVDETSGLAHFNRWLWTHNDSGGQPELYGIDPDNGRLVKTVRISNANNKDWEDLTQDDNFIYIADTGNNRGDRREFQIYKVAKSDILKPKKEVTAKLISFVFEKQPENLKPYRHNYDIEALCVVDNQLMFFSKNWANNKTYLYQIDNGVAKRIKKYHTNGLVTGCTYDAKKRIMYLIGYHRYIWFNMRSPFVYTIENFNTTKECKTKHLLKSIKGFQVEAIDMANGQLFFTNEDNKYGKQALWKLSFD